MNMFALIDASVGIVILGIGLVMMSGAFAVFLRLKSRYDPAFGKCADCKRGLAK